MASITTGHDYMPTIQQDLPLAAMQQQYIQAQSTGRMSRKNKELAAENHSQLDAILVIDASESVKRYWSLIQNFCKDCTRQMFAHAIQEEKGQLADDPLRMAIVQFATKVDVKQTWTADIEELNAGINQSRMIGNTNTAGALETCCTLHNEQGRHGARKLVIMITDGVPNDKKSAQNQADILKDSGITLIMITVGKLKDETMDYMSGLVSLPTTEHLIAAESFNSLPKVLPTLLGAANCGNIQITPLPLRNPGSFRGETMITVELQNKTAAITNVLQIRVRCNNQYLESVFVTVPAIRVGEKVCVQVPHTFKSNIPITKTNAKVEYELYDGSRLLQRATYELCLADFIRDLEPDFLPITMYANVLDGLTCQTQYQQEIFNKINILIYGWVGAGKSSYLNTVATLLDPLNSQVKHTLAKVVGGVSHATTKVQHYHIDTAQKINIIDTPGLEKGTYNTKELELILAGGIADKTELVKKQQGEQKIDLDQMETAHHDLIHAVVIFMPIDLMASEDAMNMVREQLRVCEGMDYSPIIMLCKVDETVEEMRANPLGFDEYTQLVTKREDLADRLGYPKARILYALSYTDEKERTWEVDALAYSNMEHWIDAAKTFMIKRQQFGLRAFKKQGRNKNRAKDIKRLEKKHEEERERMEKAKQDKIREEKDIQAAKDASLANQRKDAEEALQARNKEPIEKWLKSRGLGEYAEKFIADKCDNIGTLQLFSISELADLADEYQFAKFDKKKFIKGCNELIASSERLLSGDESITNQNSSGSSNAADPGSSPQQRTCNQAVAASSGRNLSSFNFLGLFGH